MGMFTNGRRLYEVRFESEKEFESEIYANSKLLFGKKTVLIDAKKKLEGKTLGGTIPDGFLFDLSDQDDPRFYLIEVELVRHGFYRHIFPQITKFFAVFNNREQRQKLAETLFQIIDSEEDIKQQFTEYVGGTEIFKLVNDTIENTKNILIVIDGEMAEFEEISDVYKDTWGSSVKHLILRKYSDGQDEVYHLEPDFEVIEFVGDDRVLIDREGYTEEHHTDGISDQVSSIYQELKRRALEINPNLIFNPTKFYISIKGRKNLVFIKLLKSKIRLTPLRPENEIRECIKSYSVISLVESVQRFWNSPCAAVIVDNADGMDEIVELLTPLLQDPEPPGGIEN